MTITKFISYFITVSMAGVIIWAQGEVSIFDSPIPSMPWGVVSLVDLYSGVILFSLWIFYKENLLPAIVWTFFIMTLGSFTIALYIIYSIKNSDGNIQKFFMGQKN
jgi:FtsH-binding integral membrane protein